MAKLGETETVDDWRMYHRGGFAACETTVTHYDVAFSGLLAWREAGLGDQKFMVTRVEPLLNIDLKELRKLYESGHECGSFG